MTRVMGLDLSIAATGIALPGIAGQLATIVPEGESDRRLCYIRDALEYYVEQTSPQVAVIEQVPPSMRGGAITIVRLALVHGVAREVLARAGVPHVYVVTSWLKKYATGSGGAKKQDMIDNARDAGYEPRDDNEADAFWCRAAGRHRYDGKTVGVRQALAADALLTVAWPRLDRK
jgi:Holliday junction resolvasome RuvABC endonuclease subunit